MIGRAVAILSLLGVIIFGARAAGQSASGRAMTLDDLIGAVRVSDPQLSPDGRTVAYVRTTTNVQTGARNADIWAVAADGTGSPKALIAGDKGDNTLRFSPDGKRVAFISTRDGAPQVYVGAADGSGVAKLTAI